MAFLFRQLALELRRALGALALLLRSLLACGVLLLFLVRLGLGDLRLALRLRFRLLAFALRDALLFRLLFLFALLAQLLEPLLLGLLLAPRLFGLLACLALVG